MMMMMMTMTTTTTPVMTVMTVMIVMTVMVKVKRVTMVMMVLMVMMDNDHDDDEPDDHDDDAFTLTHKVELFFLSHSTSHPTFSLVGKTCADMSTCVYKMENYVPRQGKTSKEKLKTTWMWYGVVEPVKPPYISLRGLPRRGAGLTVKLSWDWRFLPAINLAKARATSASSLRHHLGVGQNCFSPLTCTCSSLWISTTLVQRCQIFKYSNSLTCITHLQRHPRH